MILNVNSLPLIDILNPKFMKNFIYSNENLINLIYLKLPEETFKTCKNDTDCKYFNINQECLLCKEDLFLDDKLCLKKCPNGKFISKNNKCDKCNKKCRLCKGINNGDCDDCNFPYVFYDGNCLDHCPENTFKIQISNQLICKSILRI